MERRSSDVEPGRLRSDQIHGGRTPRDLAPGLQGLQQVRRYITKYYMVYRMYGIVCFIFIFSLYTVRLRFFQPRSGRGTRQHARLDQQHRSRVMGATSPVPGALQDRHDSVAVRRTDRIPESRVLGVQRQSDKHDRNHCVARGLRSIISFNYT